MASNDDSWVETSIKIMRQNDAYRSYVIDEWYESLPLFTMRESRLGIQIYFGENIRVDDREGKVRFQALPPHISCFIEFPDRELRWTQLSPREPSIWEPSNVPIRTVQKSTQTVMALRRRYYHDLSMFLETVAKDVTIKPDLVRREQLLDRLFEAASPTLYFVYNKVAKDLPAVLQNPP